MRLARGLACAVGVAALSLLGSPARADEPTPIHLVEVYRVTPGVSATHEVTLSTNEPLLGEQCQSMGTGARATSTVSVDVAGVSGCLFTWDLDDAGAEVVSVDAGAVFHFHSVSASLLEGFSSPEAAASIESVTLIARASEIVDASDGGTVTSPGASTKMDASTVTWENVTGDVSATGRVDATLAAMSSPPTTTPPPTVASQDGRGAGTSSSSLAPILAITGAVLLLILVGAVVRSLGRSRRASADAQFERDAAMRATQRSSALRARRKSTPYAAEGARSADRARDLLLPGGPPSREEAPPKAVASPEREASRFIPPDNNR